MGILGHALSLHELNISTLFHFAFPPQDFYSNNFYTRNYCFTLSYSSATELTFS